MLAKRIAGNTSAGEFAGNDVTEAAGSEDPTTAALMLPASLPAALPVAMMHLQHNTALMAQRLLAPARCSTNIFCFIGG